MSDKQGMKENVVGVLGLDKNKIDSKLARERKTGGGGESGKAWTLVKAVQAGQLQAVRGILATLPR